MVFQGLTAPIHCHIWGSDWFCSSCPQLSDRVMGSVSWPFCWKWIHQVNQSDFSASVGVCSECPTFSKSTSSMANCLKMSNYCEDWIIAKLFSEEDSQRQLWETFTNTHLKLYKLYSALNYTHILFPKWSTNVNKLDEHIQMIPESSLTIPRALLQDPKFIAYYVQLEEEKCVLKSLWLVRPQQFPGQTLCVLNNVWEVLSSLKSWLQWAGGRRTRQWL